MSYALVEAVSVLKNFTGTGVNDCWELYFSFTLVTPFPPKYPVNPGYVP